MKLTLQNDFGLLEFEVIYSKRKTIAIIINSQGEVLVRAPQRTSDTAILELVNRKSAWITRKQQEMEQKKLLSTERQFTEGKPLPYLGCDYPLSIRLDNTKDRVSVVLTAGVFVIETPLLDNDLLKRVMEIWYRQAARQYICSRIEYYRPILNVKPNRITIRQQKTRWGSCSGQGNLSFNWRAVMAPAPIMDYIIAHELCHLIHHNHSRDFWDLLGSIMPDYKARREWLKKNGTALNW